MEAAETVVFGGGVKKAPPYPAYGARGLEVS
jgi:hypothetical protein